MTGREMRAPPSAAGVATDHARVALFTPKSPPILRSTDPIQVARIFKERKRYKLEVESRQAEVPWQQTVPYTASIDRSLLKTIMFMGSFDDIDPEATVESLTSEQIKEYLLSSEQNANQPHDTPRLQEAVDGLKLPISISDPHARITTYCADISERLESIEYSDFKTENPRYIINLVIDGIKPPALKSSIEDRVKIEPKLEKVVRKFIRRLNEDARACQAFGQQVGHNDRSYGNAVVRSNNTSNKHAVSALKERFSLENIKNTQKTAKMASTCLYPPHKEKGIRHYISDCKACPEPEKARYLANFRKERKTEIANEQKAQRLTATAIQHGKNNQVEESSVRFSAMFADRYCEHICAENGADGSIIDAATLRRITAARADPDIQNLNAPRVFYMAAAASDGKPVKPVCPSEVLIDIELHIRHKTALKLGNVRWLVTEKRLSEPLLGRPTLEGLGLSTCEMLATAADRFAGTVDAERLVDSVVQYGGGRVSRVMEGVFLADGGEKENEDEEELEECCDIGEEPEHEWEQTLTEKLKEAQENGIISSGRKMLEIILRKYRQNVSIRYNGEPPARVRPLELRISNNAHPVRAKTRRYSPEKRRFLRNYVSQLEKLGLVKKADCTVWVSAPLIVPKRPPAMYTLTVDYRPLNADIIKITWPVPHIDAVLQEMQGSQAFATTDFTSGYWQLPMHPDSQYLHASMAPDCVVQPTRTTQGGCNSAANFQACVEPCFKELRPNLLAWLDDFALSYFRRGSAVSIGYVSAPCIGT